MCELIPKVDLPEMQRGPWKVERFTVSDSQPLFRHRRLRPGTYTRLMRSGRGVIMSDTPAEMLDHMWFVRAATGRVLIGGLGLGMCVGAVLAKADVTEVDVVEIDPDIIAMVGPHYSDPRVNIINADLMNYCPRGVRYNAVWCDIWGDVSADDLPAMQKLNRRWGQKSDWHGCWGEDLVRRAA